MVTDSDLRLAHEEAQRDDQERRWANRHRSQREQFHCWGGHDCNICSAEPFFLGGVKWKSR